MKMYRKRKVDNEYKSYRTSSKKSATSNEYQQIRDTKLSFTTTMFGSQKI